MRVYETPGVYFERPDASGGGVAALRTDIAGFVGICERGPLNIAVPVESQRQFNAWFGATIDNGFLAYCARGFFENGGRRLWVVRVASAAASPASLVLHDGGGPAWRVEASSVGVWGNGVALRTTETRRAQVRGTVDHVDRRRLRVSSVAGLATHVLIELRVPGASERAVIESVDAVSSSIVLRAPLALMAGGMRPLVESVTYTLNVYETGRLIATFGDLSLVCEHPRYGPAVLRQPWQTIDVVSPDAPRTRAPDADLAVELFRVARNRGVDAPPPIVVRELRDAARRKALALLADASSAAPVLPSALTGGADGLAALHVSDFIGTAVAAGAGAEEIAAARRGIAALDVVDEIALTGVPDIHIRPQATPRYAPEPCLPDRCLPHAAPKINPPMIAGDTPPQFSLEEIYRVQAALLDHCEKRRDRIALLDAPFEACSQLSFAVAELRAWRNRFDSAFAALYAPWLNVIDPLRARAAAGPLTRAIPPSGHVAGLFAATDLKRGVHHAPANVPIAWAQDVTLPIDGERHGLLNSLGVDVVRAIDGRGLRLLGARTLSSDAAWRFVTVRRLVSMITRAIEQAIQWAVFEGNDWRTRTKLAFVIGSFLRECWSRGALVGAAVEEAFFVRCDESNNPPDQRDRGQLVVDVGVAPVVPFEFIVLRIGRDANGFVVNELDGVAG